VQSKTHSQYIVNIHQTHAGLYLILLRVDQEVYRCSLKGGKGNNAIIIVITLTICIIDVKKVV